MNLNPPSERPVCPMRPSGGPCVGHDDPGEGCAWWDVDECAILSLTKSIYAIEEALRENLEQGDEVFQPKGPLTTIGGESTPGKRGWYDPGKKGWYDKKWVTGPGEIPDDDVPF